MDTRLKEMEQAAVDLFVLSLNPPGVQIYDDTKKAVSLVQDMNDRLAEIVQSRCGVSEVSAAWRLRTRSGRRMK